MSRGRGRGGKTSLTKEQLSVIGVTAGESLPVPITEPPVLFPPINRKPIPLSECIEADYLLILKQGFIDRMNMSGAYLKPSEPNLKQSEQAIDKLLAQIPNTKEKFNWNFYPHELRPKLVAKKRIKTVEKKVDITSRLNQLERIEENSEKLDEVNKEAEEENEDDKEEIIEEDEDEEMDEGTDYANNYFDNGEGYEDEDDNLDEGPIY
ncbi:DNA-directed RNA polymerase III subunit RPC7-like [Agrilus planipennis]|uniref:DNA-directed RNA polymerase III subunit RPC7-like n=1 Tax=Agrilus planipennis TaxID=224129 RepID=A0A7F5R4J6_AGRPL|nr:DNA-directed RNA polymerase III subunit RPC7-like [Agrilus planipennis]XP_025830803.1 DNA-directed RNA polymerase III subunit RPC7-like [Agrilus planipennis]